MMLGWRKKNGGASSSAHELIESQASAHELAESQTVRYRLARTVAQVNSTVEIAVADDGTLKFTRASTVTITGASDPDGERAIDLGRGSVKVDLHFTADGRLSNVQRSATGVGATVISAGLTVATAAASVIAPTFFGPGELQPLQVQEPGLPQRPDEPSTPAAPPTPAERYTLEHEDEDRRRTQLREQVGSLQGALIAFSSDLPDADPTQANLRQSQLQTLTATQTAVQSALADADAAYQAWKQSTYPPITRTLTNTLDLASLPRIKTISDERRFFAGDLLSQRATARALGVVLARFEPGSDGEVDIVPAEESQTSEGLRATESEGGESGAGDRRPLRMEVPTASAIVYRRARPMTIAVYTSQSGADRAELDLVGQPLTLVQTIPVWAVDASSPLSQISLEHPIFTSTEAGVAFDDNGLLSELSSQRTSAVAAVAKAISGAGGVITGALDDVGKVQKALMPADPATAALTQKVEQAELQARLHKAQATIADPKP